MLKEWDIVQEWLKESEEKGIQVGMEKGIQAGMEKGIQAGMEKGIQAGMESIRQVILTFLKSRMKIDKEIILMLNKIENIDSLNLIFQKSLEVNNLEEIKEFTKSLL